MAGATAGRGAAGIGPAGIGTAGGCAPCTGGGAGPGGAGALIVAVFIREVV